MKIFVAIAITAISMLCISAPAFAQNVLTETYSPLLQKVNKWSAEGNFGVKRNQDPNSDAVIGGTVSVYYEFKPDRLIYSGLGYAKMANNDEDRNRQYGLDDLYLGYFAKNILKFDNGISIDWDNTITAPTSDVSRRASLLGSLTTGLVIRYPINKYFYAVTRHNGMLNAYTYQTSDVAGASYNYPWMISNSAGLGFRLLKTATTLDYSEDHLVDYGGTTNDIQTVRLAINVPLQENATITAYARWRDRTVTNYKFLDPDTRVIGSTLTIYY